MLTYRLYFHIIYLVKFSCLRTIWFWLGIKVPSLFISIIISISIILLNCNGDASPFCLG